MVLALVPTVAFAEEPVAVAWIGETGYETLEAAVTAAASGDTIQLGEGNYTLYGVSSTNTTKDKDLTFIGKGEKTIWQIGADTPKTNNGEFDSDYSFKDSESVTFKNMTLRTGNNGADADYLGFSHTKITNVENCTMLGRTAYWGYTSATFKDTTFNCPNGSYALWTYSSPTMTFDNCTFNSSGKVINVYNEGGTPNVTVNFNNCTVNSKNPESLSVMNINDSKVESFTINFTGNNKINDIKADGIQVTGGSHASDAKDTANKKKTSEQATCSKLFEFNMKYGNGNNKRTTVKIDDKTVWTDGKMVGHKYTDGYKDNAFTVTPKGPGLFEVKCDYCGYTEISTGELSNEIELERTVRQNKNSNPVSEDTPNSNKYKVANSSNITVDYTATMNMENLKWQVAGKDVKEIPGALGNASSPWELLKYLALTEQIDDRTEVILTFKFDDDKIDLEAFEKKYKDDHNVLMLTSDMFEIADGGVTFGPTKGTMTIKCNWNWNKETDPDPKITLYGFGLPVVKDNWGGNKIEITNSGCVGGTVHINPMGGAVAMAEIVPNVAADVQVQNTYQTEMSPTIQIPIVGGCKTDKFTLYYGGGSSGDSSGGSSSGGGYYHPTTTPVPVIVIPPKTGDMTVWQSILHFLGIR